MLQAKNEVDEELDFAIKEFVKEKLRELKYNIYQAEKTFVKAKKNLNELQAELKDKSYASYKEEFFEHSEKNMYTNSLNTPYQQYLQEKSSNKIT